MFLTSLMPGLAAPLAVTTFSATIVCGFMLARYAGSRARLAAREREHVFEELIDEFMHGSMRGRDLLHAAAGLDPDLFWDALGTVVPHLSRRAARDLEQTLERSRHVHSERHALRDSSPIRRERAARRLTWIGAVRHRAALRHAMARGPELVTVAAGHALARTRDRAALRWLLAHPHALEHRPPAVRLGLLRAFGRNAIADLAASLDQPIGEPRMERAVVEALALWNAKGATADIAARVKHEWRDVRVAAARALGQLGAQGHVEALVGALHDPEWQVRAQAARALGRLGATQVTLELRAALRDPAWWVRRHSAYALAALGADGERALKEVAASDPDRYARDIAAEALQFAARAAR